MTILRTTCIYRMRRTPLLRRSTVMMSSAVTPHRLHSWSFDWIVRGCCQICHFLRERVFTRCWRIANRCQFLKPRWDRHRRNRSKCSTKRRLVNLFRRDASTLSGIVLINCHTPRLQVSQAVVTRSRFSCVTPALRERERGSRNQPTGFR